MRDYLQLNTNYAKELVRKFASLGRWMCIQMHSPVCVYNESYLVLFVKMPTHYDLRQKYKKWVPPPRRPQAPPPQKRKRRSRRRGRAKKQRWEHYRRHADFTLEPADDRKRDAAKKHGENVITGASGAVARTPSPPSAAACS